MKICMVSTFPPLRCGIADYTKDLCAALVERGLEVHVLTYEERSALTYEEVEPGVKVHRALKRGATLPLTCWRKIRDISPDVIHVQSSEGLHMRLLYLFTLLNSGKMPLITTVHSAPTSWRQFPYVPFLRLLYRNSDRFWTHSTPVRNALMKHKVSPHNIAMLPHGVDTIKFQPRPGNEGLRERLNIRDGDFLLLFLGFIVPWKGVLDLVKALPRILRRAPQCKLILGGGVPSQPHRYSFYLKSENTYPLEIRQVVDSLDLKDHIIFTDYIPEPDVPEYLALADVVVFPHRVCSQSGMMHKAMAAGKPIVATATGGFLDTIVDRENGLLVPPISPPELSQAILRLIYDEELRTSLALAARRKAETELSWGKVAEATIRAYRTLAI